MSPNNVNEVANSFVLMAKAFEELPQVQLDLSHTKFELEKSRDIVMGHEVRIIDLQKEIDRHLATIRSLEVARDDAELRFLEADDRTQRALGFVKTMFGSAGGLIQALEPQVMPEPVVQAQPVEAKPEPDYHPPQVDDPRLPEAPTAPFSPEASSDTATGSSGSEVSMSGDPSNVDSWASGPGQSEADPTPASTQTDEAPQTSANNSVIHSEDAGLQTKPSGRYSGKRYYDWPTYVSFTDWMREGGKEEDYNWRPAARPAGTMF